jgi:hypothetical protein
MRDRLTELLPLLLVGVILLVFQVTRPGGVGVPFLPRSVATPEVGRAVATGVPVRSQPPGAVATVGVTFCNPAQPRFMGSIALLRAALGSTMGDPMDCEQTIDAQGNTQQRTSTGLAYRRKQSNETVFTTGWDHWALREDGAVVHWAGDEVDPPIDASVVTDH